MYTSKISIYVSPLPSSAMLHRLRITTNVGFAQFRTSNCVVKTFHLSRISQRAPIATHCAATSTSPPELPIATQFGARTCKEPLKVSDSRHYFSRRYLSFPRRRINYAGGKSPSCMRNERTRVRFARKWRPR